MPGFGYVGLQEKDVLCDEGWYGIGTQTGCHHWLGFSILFFFFFYLSLLYNSDTVISIIFATFWEGLTGLFDNLAYLMCVLILIIVNHSPNGPKIHVFGLLPLRSS